MAYLRETKALAKVRKYGQIKIELSNGNKIVPLRSHMLL